MDELKEQIARLQNERDNQQHVTYGDLTGMMQIILKAMKELDFVHDEEEWFGKAKLEDHAKRLKDMDYEMGKLMAEQKAIQA